jgi:hypothetical protein
MKRIIHLATSAALLVLLCACSEQDQEPIMKVYHGGHEYTVLEKGDTEDHGKLAYYLRYLSQDPHDETIREAELFDLYSIVAKHIDSNEYQRVVIEAVDHRGRKFGLFKASEYRDSKSVKEVLAYKEEKEPSFIEK